VSPDLAGIVKLDPAVIKKATTVPEEVKAEEEPEVKAAKPE